MKSRNINFSNQLILRKDCGDRKPHMSLIFAFQQTLPILIQLILIGYVTVLAPAIVMEIVPIVLIWVTYKKMSMDFSSLRFVVFLMMGAMPTPAEFIMRKMKARVDLTPCTSDDESIFYFFKIMPF